MNARTAAAIRKSFKASPRRWLRSFLERRFQLRGRQNLKRPLSMLFVVAWMLVFAPGCALASWEAPRTDTDPLHHATTTTLDPLGRTVGVRNALGKTRTLSYDGNGNLKTETDFRGNVTTYVYDDANRLQIKREPLGRTTTYTHDALGHVLSESVAGPSSVTRTSTYAYAHPRYARTLVEHGSGTPEVAREEYQLDAHGNALVTTNANSHTTTRTFDAFDRVETETLGGVTVTHGYDGNGNRLRTQQGAVTRSWTYDGANRVETTTDGNGKVARTSYWPTGEVQSQTNPRGHMVWEDIDAYDHVQRM